MLGDGGPDAGPTADAGLAADSGTVGADAGLPEDGGTDGGTTGADGGPYFPAGAPWTQPVDAAPLHPRSAQIIAALAAAGGWGNGDVFQIDFSVELLHADASAPLRSFVKSGDFYTPDCDFQPVPVPPGGALEGEPAYQCTGGGDCHLLVVYEPTRTLYEMWRADIQGATFNGGCLAVWDLARLYPLSGRGDQCTSADAAGYPIAPLLFTADEVAAGAIGHALRFILPNDRIQPGSFVHPSTHATSSSGAADTPIYGTRLRLKSTFDVSSLPSAGARTVARALQKYGMLLADGGQIVLTAQSDRFTTAKWTNGSTDLLAPRDLDALKVTDFEVVAPDEAPVPYDGNCVRNP